MLREAMPNAYKPTGLRAASDNLYSRYVRSKLIVLRISHCVVIERDWPRFQWRERPGRQQNVDGENREAHLVGDPLTKRSNP